MSLWRLVSSCAVFGLFAGLAACNETGSQYSAKSANSTANGKASNGSLSLNTPAAQAGVTKLRVVLMETGSCSQYPVYDTVGAWRTHPVWMNLADNLFPAFLTLHNSWFTSTTGSFFSPAPTNVCVIQYIDTPIASAAAANLDGLAAGTYALIYSMEDDNSNVIEAGISTVNVASGIESTVSIQLKNENFAPSATGTGGSIQVSFFPDGETQLAFTNASLAQAAGTCGAITLAPETASGAAVTLTQALSINLTSSSATGLFYSDAACTLAITSTPIAVGAQNVTIYYNDTATAAECPTVTATESTSQLPAVAQVENIGNAANCVTTPVNGSPLPGLVAFTTPALSQSDSACGLVTVQYQNAGVAATPSSALTLALSTANEAQSGTSGLFYSDAACTQAVTSLPLSSSSATFYFRDMTVGFPMLVVTPSNGLAPIEQAETITVGPAAKIAFDDLGTTVAANTCAPVAIIIEDASGNAVDPTSDTSVSFTVAGGGAMYSNAECTSAITGSYNIGTGEADLTVYYKGAAATGVTISVAGAGVNASLIGTTSSSLTVQ